MSSSRRSCVLAVLTTLALLAGCSKNATTSQGKGQSTAQQQPAASSTAEQAPPGPTSEEIPARAEMERDCPMKVPGAQARAEDRPEGVALIFVTSEEDQVAELQQRSRNMMQRQQEHGTSGRRGLDQPPGVDYQAMGGSGLPGSAGAPSVDSSARLEDTPQGVTIVYRALNPSDQERLRAEIHETARQMSPGQCPGMAPPEE